MKNECRRLTKQSDRLSHHHRFAGNLERSGYSELQMNSGGFMANTQTLIAQVLLCLQSSGYRDIDSALVLHE